MADDKMISRQPACNAPQTQLTSPLLYLSSEGAGWRGLVAHAFYEPAELESWITPLIPGISLLLYSGGPLRLESRAVNGPWKTIYLSPGTLSLRAGTSSYEVRWRSITALPTRTLQLCLSKDLFARTAEELAEHDPALLSLHECAGFHDPLLQQIGLSLWRELETPSPAGQFYAEFGAQLLAVHLLRHYTSARFINEPSGGLTSQQMKRVRDYVQAHLDQHLSLEALARQVGFSPYHFARLFRLTTGESPHQFIVRQRIEKAQHLLTNQEMSLARVALESGFANQSHFTQAFKRYLGLTPRAFRQEYGSCADCE